MEDLELIKILWNYMKMNHKLEKSDCILGLGCSDVNIANVASDLYFKGYADKIIFTGGLGKITQEIWKEPEANKFSKIAIENGVPKDKIYIENKSTNTGDNLRFTKKLIKENNLDIKSMIVVCKPYGEKRVYATLKSILPEYKVIVYSEQITCEEYNKKTKESWVDVLVGDVQRMELFAKEGWQIKMDVPIEVKDAYNKLVEKGYDKFIL